MRRSIPSSSIPSDSGSSGSTHRENEEPKPRHIPKFFRSFGHRMTLLILGILLAAGLTTVLLYYCLRHLLPEKISSEPLAVWALAFVFVVAGSLIAFLLEKRLFGPFDELIDVTDKIADGDFKVHVRESCPESTDFGALQRSVNYMVDELNGIEVFRQDFINNFAHEFKTPIVSIRGFAHELQVGDLTEEQRQQYARIIVDESDRLVNMASNILLLSKLEKQQNVSEKTTFCLDEQLRKAILALEKQWSSKEIELDLDLHEVMYEFNADILMQVWLNLFSNAFKFTPNGGTVSCTLQEADGEAVVVIRDTGMGMTEEVRRHIFEKFYQGDTSHNGSGNGIGLNIVGRILELCGGSIDVASTPGLGSAFTVHLPLSRGGGGG